MSRYTSIMLFVLFPIIVLSQVQTDKVIKEHTQAWLSLNTINKFSDHWGIIADAHIRTNGILQDNNFYFIRGGITYIPNSLVSITAGYAHMWLGPTKEGWNTYSDENRIYQQAQLTTKMGNVSILQRIRNEQRWQEKIVNDLPTDKNRFTDRIRYLVSFNIPVFKKKTAPSLVISDEILIHFGQEVIYNTFDQNRLFIGIKQSLSPKLSFDFGYMNLYQQKYSGYQYDMNHTLRLFFYLNSNLKFTKSVPVQPTSDQN